MIKFTGILVLFMMVLAACGKGYKPAESLIIKKAGLSAHISHDAGPEVNIAEHVHFELTGTRLDEATITWGHSLSGQPEVCTGSSHGAHEFGVTCNQAGVLIVTARAQIGDEIAEAYSQLTVVDNPAPTPTPPPPAGNVVEFRIAAGTGSSSWNTQATAIQLFVGQSFKLVNDDTVPHQMHTNGIPFSHGNEVTPGSSQTQTVVAAYSSEPAPNGNGPLYDHLYQNNNPRPNVWIYAYNGGQIYQTNCQSCHGALASSTKRNKTAAQITSALNTQPQMAPLRNTLSAKQIEAIAYALKN